jgi:ferredoxin
MFRNLMDWAFKQADVAPTFQAQHCLSVRGTTCTVCADICPHRAITIKRLVQIDPIDCTGCGLCVSACPSHALTAKTRAPVEVGLRCSQVDGESTSVSCLARLQASDLVRIGAKGEPVTLARGNCGDCPIGSDAVPALLDSHVERAREVLALHDRELEVTVVECERFDLQTDRREISRRQLFSGGWQELRRSSGALLAPLERFAAEEEPPPDRRALPHEYERLVQAIALAQPSEETLVPLRLPEVLEGCILCPACTRACPTNAIKRVFDGDAAGGSRIELEADRCTGCDACVSACPVDVIRMRDDVTWGEIQGPPQIVYRAERPAMNLGAVARPSAAPVASEATDHDASMEPPDISSA